MPDSSAGTKELYFAWIATVRVLSGLGFHSDVPRGTLGARREEFGFYKVTVAVEASVPRGTFAHRA
jgi:hypothetical protein